MLTEYATAGIQRFGADWRHNIDLAVPIAALSSDVDADLDKHDINKIRDEIALRIRKIANISDEETQSGLEKAACQLETVDPTVEAVKAALAEVFNQFDYYRVKIS